MFNIIFPVIIFISLAIIVFIVGKHLPEFVDIKKGEESQVKKSKYFKKLFKVTFDGIKSFLVWLTEYIIKGIKNFLNLIQSWIAANKRKEKKEDLFEGIEERTLEEKDSFLKKIARKEDTKEELKKEKRETRQKIKKNFFVDFKNNLKEKILEKKRQKINQVFQENDYSEDDNSQFSDGIVKIHEKIKNDNIQKKNLIKEVVEIKKNQTEKMNLDEEIGVDRNILEKKLINKIGQNPRDKEVYRQLGELYLKMKNYIDAENCYKQVLRIAVRDVDAKRKIERIKLLKRAKQK